MAMSLLIANAKDYYEAAQERIDAYASQMRMEIL